MINLLYIFAFLPWLTDYFESGRWPATAREAVTELTVSVVLVIGVHFLIRQRRQSQKKTLQVERLSRTDPLTQLGNSQSFQETLVREVARARRSGQPFSCVLLDLSDFRLINDQFGHEKGNQVLQAVARMIRQIIRQKTDSAYRYGGDGFALILPESDGAQALSVAQRLRETLMALKPPTIPKKALSANFVLASLREDARAEDLLRMLDRALVETKARGKDLIYEAPWAED